LVEVTEFAQHTRWLNTPILWFTDAGLIVFAVLMLAACASAPRPQPAAVPENLRVPEGELLLRAVARGAQRGGEG
jgi:undecaprenyl-diphosphatase